MWMHCGTTCPRATRLGRGEDALPAFWRRDSAGDVRLGPQVNFRRHSPASRTLVEGDVTRSVVANENRLGLQKARDCLVGQISSVARILHAAFGKRGIRNGVGVDRDLAA